MVENTHFKALRESLFHHSSWSVRNQALKTMGLLEEESISTTLVEVIRDRRPARWWRRCCGDPFFQVGFIRRNAWQLLKRHLPPSAELITLLPLGLNDPYYEVRAATWEALGQAFQEASFELPAEQKAELQTFMLAEKNFEILISALGTADRILPTQTLLDWSKEIETFKHWRVRSAYLDAMEKLSHADKLNIQSISEILNRFNMRSEYFKPVFMLKERGARLEQLVRGEA